MVLTMEANGTDQKTGQSGAINMVNDMWLATVPGYDEVKNFQIRAAQKMGYLTGGGMAQVVGAMQPQAVQGFAEIAKEMQKIEGVPVQQVTRMGGTADEAGAPAQRQPQAQSQQPSQQQSVGAAVAAGALGRFGGFGRNRNKGNENKSNDPAPAPEQGAAGSGMLLETTTELKDFSTAAADTSKFEVPAGFKLVESPMAKGLK